MRQAQKRLFRALSALGYAEQQGLPRTGTPPTWPQRPQRRNIKNVNKVIAVSSAKGGVGKSTVAANLSVAFARLGLRSGILDADVFGPSIPNLFDLSGEPRLSSSNQLLPLTNYGVKTMSLGYLVGEKSALVWRGPMVIKAIQQLLHQVEWGGLDILVLDLPPGTGDVQLTITQQVILDGSVIVTTPHSLATRDAVKGISMFRTVNVNILGLVQNMSLYNCPHCHTQSHIFGSDQLVKSMCEEHGMDLLGDVPLHPAVCVQGDGAKLAIVSHPSGDIASAFIKIARAICHKINLPADY